MKVKVVVALVVALLLLPGVSHALTHEQQILVGLKGVYIIVEEMEPQAERLGLTRAQIQTDVELRLRKAGVRVLTEEECFKMLGGPVLHVDVSTFSPPAILIVAYSVRVELIERVALESGFKTLGGIWHTHYIGVVGTKYIRDIRETVGSQVEQFINDYLAANPK